MKNTSMGGGGVHVEPEEAPSGRWVGDAQGGAASSLIQSGMIRWGGRGWGGRAERT